jgi:hypothetical protein
MEDTTKMKFTLVYNDSTILISIPRNKTISALRAEAYNIFHPKGKFTLIYKNRDLTPYSDTFIGKYFTTLKHVNILIRDKVHGSLSKSSSLPSLMNAEYLTQSKRALTKCSICANAQIGFFCRECCVFLCKYCRSVKTNKHYCHRTVTLYPEDLNKSAMLYKEIIKGELIEAKNAKVQRDEENASMKNVNDSNSSSNNNVKVKVNQFKSQLEMKLNELFELMLSIQKKMPVNLDDVSKSKSNVITKINNYNKEIDDYGKNEDITNADKLIKMFDELNHKEMKINEITSIIPKMQKWERINTLLSRTCKRIKRIMFTIINSSLDNNNNNSIINDNGIDNSDYHQTIEQYINYYYSKQYNHHNYNHLINNKRK